MKIAAHPELSRALADALDKGPIPFRRFMELALYHPAGGYYCREGARIGPEGDFYTGPHQSPWLGRMIARFLESVRRRMDDAHPLHLWEYGPGEGWLALDVLEAARPGCGLAYTLVEQSAPARKRMRARLGERAAVRFAHAAEYPPPGFEGVVLAHEFLDALPFHVIVQQETHVEESYVEWRGGRLRFCEGAPSDARLTGWFSDLGVRLSPGQTAEVNLCAYEWVREVARRMARGAVLIFDYGFSARVLYDATRPKGALRGYRNHTLTSDVLSRPGETDITTHVDFTSVLRAAEGMELAGFTDQARFLLGAGLAEALEDAGEADEENARRERQAVMGVMNPAGLGGAIKVMLLSKNLDLGDLEAFSMKPDDRASFDTLAG